jgi:hypothetical protein
MRLYVQVRKERDDREGEEDEKVVVDCVKGEGDG